MYSRYADLSERRNAQKSGCKPNLQITSATVVSAMAISVAMANATLPFLMTVALRPRDGGNADLQARFRRGLRHPRHQFERRVRDRLRHGLKAAGVSVPIIYITGNESAAVREAALGSGCIAFLTSHFPRRS